ncbi:unnamed protein product, partial [Strongylus vulgaris]
MPGQFVAITNTNIVDESGRDLACGGNLQVIRPKSDNLIRLTAVQKLDPEDAETTAKPILHVMSTTNRPAPKIRPIAPRVAPPIHSSFSISAPAQKELVPFAVLPISPTQVLSNHRSGTSRDIEPPVFMPIRKTNVTLPNMEPPSTLPTPVVAQTKRTPSVQDLISRVAGQPILEGQLKFLAKKFGFDRMTGEQAAQRLTQIHRMLGSLKSAPTNGGRQPISPVNAKEMNSISPDLISKIASFLPSSSTINGALTNRITQFIALVPH